MNHSFTLLYSVLLLASCEQHGSHTSKTDDTSLRNRIAQLEKENMEKDSMLNISLEFYNQIRTNLESIELKQQEIRLRSSDPEQSESDKEWILDQINFINFLRTENAKKVKQLLHQLYVKDQRNSALEAMTQDILKTLDAKEFELSELKYELNSLNQSYSKLFDAYQEKYELAEVLRDDLNRVYYSYGTLEELKKNHVVEQNRGFIGIHGDIRIAGNLNQKYFSTLDMREDNEIFIEGSKPQFVTDHPSNSYQLVAVGKNTKIQIKDPHEFWKISNYLIVVVK
jgi:chromosome segregation ATPase